MAPAAWSKTWTFFEDDWHEGNLPVWGVRTHAIWLGSSVFDGARVFDGAAPDLDLHCARVNASAKTMFLKPLVPVEQWVGLVREGMKRFEPGTTLYIRPMYWAERAGPLALPPDPESTRWCLDALRRADAHARGLLDHAVAVSAADVRDRDGRCQIRLPLSQQCTRDVRGALARLRQCIVCDMLGNVAELANSNLFMAKDGVVFTPMPNGTFLDGITRQRVIKLMRAAGVEVVETTLRYRDFEAADEIFASGNASKVVPITRIGERSLQPGPLYRQARELYWDYAHGK